MQRQEFLDNHLIADADIPKIGSGRMAVLRSYGIETALDIEKDKILEIDGFGEVLTGNLLAWREEVNRTFRFNPTVPPPQAKVQEIEIKFRQLRQSLELELQKGPAALQGIAASAEQHLSQSYREIQRAMGRVAQAEADLAVFDRGGKAP
jgi:DNA-binding helix-hairpin-helix protein with protein kinase domain